LKLQYVVFGMTLPY